MPLHERVTRNEILLPGIILCNKMVADAPKADGLIKPSESNTKLPNLQVTHASSKFYSNSNLWGHLDFTCSNAIEFSLVSAGKLIVSVDSNLGFGLIFKHFCLKPN